MKIIEHGRCRLRGGHCAWCQTHPEWRAQVGTTSPCGDDRGPANGAEKPTAGPGTHLRGLLSKFGIKAAPGCACNSLARKMDIWGVSGCRAHLEEIVDAMTKEAIRRKWKLPFKRMGARGLVLLAIRMAHSIPVTASPHSSQTS